jgi:uncharacterized protein (TIGR03435 family)
MRALPAIAGTLLVCSGATAQTFEVASVRRSPTDSESFVQAHPGGRLDISHQTLRTLIAFAWRYQTSQIAGGPSWVRSEYFSIAAKSTNSPDEEGLLNMTRSLLEERFALLMHSETKDALVYSLVRVKTGRKSAPGLKVTLKGSCNPVGQTAAPDPRACGAVGLGLDHLEAQEISMPRLAEILSRVLDRKVIDKTSASGNFNVTLRWAPDEHEAARPRNDVVEVLPDTASIFTAIEEQLGLKLESTRGKVEFLVIDHAAKPDEN